MKLEDGHMRVYKRDPAHRVFVNRNLRLEKIKFFGFDLDYTLAVYKSPELEELLFKFAIDRLITIGYPEELRSFQYKPIFPLRGLWFDVLYGNLLKVDGFGNILVGMHGFRFMKPTEIGQLYPNKFLQLSLNRVYVFDTLYSLPEIYLEASLIDYFDSNPEYIRVEDSTGVRKGEVFMSYHSIFQDIREAFEWVHQSRKIKDFVWQNPKKYVVRDDRLKPFLRRIREVGKKSFLLTNSDYHYSNGIMNYLLGPNWIDYFDFAVVDAKKPKWFAEGTVFREVNKVTSTARIGIHTGPLEHGKVYSGGSCEAFKRLVKAEGRDVLYIGDHIYGDVLRSKKTRGWRTFLVVPELAQELTVWTEGKPLFDKLRNLESRLSNMYKDLDSNSKEKPMVDDIISEIRKITYNMDNEYGMLGSVFRSGARTSFFAAQVERYADLYAASCCNLFHYPLFYFFRAPMTLMPHESTVGHDAVMLENDHTEMVKRQTSVREEIRGLKTQPTFCHEEDDDENSSDSLDNKYGSSDVAAIASHSTVHPRASSP
uniref:Cytosolic purine 5'-nucleotidase n=1 Tax=Syphacia muris TaxID=451379 RepID=A0A0N5AJ27_9BILA